MNKEENNIRKILGKNVRYYRYQNRLTQEKVAERCELSLRYVSDIENGKGNISVDTLNKLANILKVKPYMLIKSQKINRLPKNMNKKK